MGDSNRAANLRELLYIGREIIHSGPDDIKKTNHASFKITANLHAALSLFRSFNVMGFIWADMLCINQGDVQERSGQVRFMKSIYATADSVTVWLGNDHELKAALFATENYELTLFSLALEEVGWKGDTHKSLGKFQIKNYVQRMQRGEASRQCPARSSGSHPDCRGRKTFEL
jgi:hypothetical protein